MSKLPKLPDKIAILQPKGRGALSNPEPRYARQLHVKESDGWPGSEALSEERSPQDEPPPLQTTLIPDQTRRALNYIKSPDIPFDRSINVYRGCEHGCIYCYARPSHAYWGLSPGLDFESRIIYKPEVAQLLRRELDASQYQCQPIALGSNTDPYQPVEKKLGLTRQVLTVLREYHHPVTIITKSARIEKDSDILADMAQEGLVQVMLSFSSLQTAITRELEPRTTAPARRLKTLTHLSALGIPVGVLVAPVIPVLTDGEMEHILSMSRSAGARYAAYVLLRLPQEVGPLFTEWLQTYEPGKAQHILSLLKQSHQNQVHDTRPGLRMRGTGAYADMLAQRFRLLHKKLGFETPVPLNTHLFRSPQRGRQLSLF